MPKEFADLAVTGCRALQLSRLRTGERKWYRSNAYLKDRMAMMAERAGLLDVRLREVLLVARLV